MNIALNIPKGGYAKNIHDIRINDLRSKQALNMEVGGISNIDLIIQSGAILSEQERYDIPYA